jgi:hypothetical protein
MREIKNLAALSTTVFETVKKTPVLDIHTHIFEEAFGDLLLRGPEALITYHYLQAETNRVLHNMTPAQLMALSTPQQARLVWQKLFVERSPISEAARGVVTAWNRLGVPSVRDYDGVLKRFAGVGTGEMIDMVFKAANVRGVIMTNDPFNPAEQAVWNGGKKHDARFRAALRIDPLLLQWPAVWQQVRQAGYSVSGDLPDSTYPEIARFLKDWAAKMKPVYMAASLPPSFIMPDDSPTGRVLANAVLPACRDLGIPFAMMIGVKKRLMPELGDAGDGQGLANLDSISHLCRAYPNNKFLLTVLARENHHEAIVLARKFRNLHVFGCWWFNNNPSIVEEITRSRVEMLGLSMTPQHSDARVLDQLVYKWAHSRKVIAEVLEEKYAYLIDEGWYPTEEEITRDVALLLGGEFERFIGA